MIEVLLCSVVTILPDFLYRRFMQGKRLGREITLYSIWYELRYGITACLGLTIVLLTLILYFHPSTSSAVSFYRTVPILPEGSGRVEGGSSKAYRPGLTSVALTPRSRACTARAGETDVITTSHPRAS